MIREFGSDSSSTIHYVRYNDETLELEITFKGKVTNTYVYFNVPVEVFDAFEASESKGSFHAQQIYRKYEYKKISLGI